MSAERHVHVAIVGAGFSGLGAAMALRADGIYDFVILEKGTDLGGTWRDNSYPGCACDIPSILYSWSGELNPNWSQAFASQAEIWAYMRGVVDRQGLRPYLRLEHEVLEVRWDEELQRWWLETSRGTMSADFVIAAVGGLSEPAIPRLPGLERFAGTMFHSARWRHDHDLRGGDVAVVGTGASAIQFVPEIQPQVRQLHLFQRTPPWVLPRGNPRIPRRWRERFARHPAAQRLLRRAVFSLFESFHFAFTHPWLMRATELRARRHIKREVADPVLRAKLIPHYRVGCKRVLGSDTWYPALTCPNVEVVSSGIREVTAGGIVDGDGVEHRVQTIIFGTGFHVTDPPVADRVHGRDGRTMADVWQGSMKAHLGLMVNGFPNLFMLLGPNTGLGHNSVLLMAEAQIRYVVKALRYMRASGAKVLEVTPTAQARFVAEVDEGTRGSVWTTGGCVSWYLDATGRNSTLWPGSVRAFQRRLARFDPADYDFESPRPVRQPMLASAARSAAVAAAAAGSAAVAAAAGGSAAVDAAAAGSAAVAAAVPAGAPATAAPATTAAQAVTPAAGA